MTEDLEIETESLSEEPESVKSESVESTVRDVFDRLKEASGDDDETEPRNAESSEDIDPSDAGRALAKSKKGKKRQVFVPAEQVGEPTETPGTSQAAQKIDPPTFFDVQNKEFFNRQAPEVQREIVKWFQNVQAKTTQTWQQLQGERTKYSRLSEVLNKHLPRIDAGNLDSTQVVEQLFEFQHQINEDDVGAILKMMQYRNLSLDDLQDRLVGESSRPAKNGNEPSQRSLTMEDVRKIIEEREVESRKRQTIESAANEIRSLQRETDNQGKYLYPELHDPVTAQRLQQLVGYYLQVTGGNWKDAYRRAVLADRQARGIQDQTPRLTRQDVQAVTQASSSLRSRGNPGIPTKSGPSSNESIRESIEAELSDFFSNNQ